MPGAGSVVVVGDALIDELRDDTGVREFVGGAALNVAVGLSRLGFPTTLIAMVGADAAGDNVRAYLDDYGVDLVETPAPHGTARAVSTRSAGGEPTYWFNEAAQRRLIDIDDRARALIRSADVTVISCVALDDPAQSEPLAEALAARRGLFAIDPNPRAGMLQDAAAFRAAFERIAASADLVKVGDDDAALLYGIPLDDLVTQLRALGAPAVLATRGAGGAEVIADNVRVARPIATLSAPVVDTMGAGDAVLASAVASLLADAEEQKAAAPTAEEWAALLERAMGVAAATCRFEGALLRLPSALTGLGAGFAGS